MGVVAFLPGACLSSAKTAFGIFEFITKLHLLVKKIQQGYCEPTKRTLSEAKSPLYSDKIAIVQKKSLFAFWAKPQTEYRHAFHEKFTFLLMFSNIFVYGKPSL